MSIIQYKFNRQTNDFLLTDLLPYEKGNHYTHIHFYEYLQTNKKRVNKLIKRINKEEPYFDSSWHSAPLKFKISKAKEGFREISIVNPLGLLESLAFISLFENDIVNIMHNKRSFSARKASRTNSLTYKKNKNQTVFYTEDPNSKKQLLISLESKGTYFKHYPFKNITRMVNSSSFLYSRDKYNSLLVLDIQDCFSNIYSHSFKWLISNKVYDSKSLSKSNQSNSVYRNIDVFLQNLNGSKTNGIIVGPEVSRLLAEFLFIHIDQELMEVLKGKDINSDSDYTIYRFVDDYYIYTNTDEVQAIIKEELIDLLNKYQLKLNESKVNQFDKDELLNEWVLKITPIINLIEYIFENESMPTVKYFSENKLVQKELEEAYLQVAYALTYLEELSLDNQIKQKRKRVKYSELRSKVNEVIILTKENALVSSYILSVILKKIEGSQEKHLSINMTKDELITFIFFTYTKKVSYSSSQKLIRILTLLLEQDNGNFDIQESIERNIERFENDIFKKHTSDWIDLLLFFSSYQINLTNNLIEKVTNNILLDKKPIHIAALCLFYESNFISSSSFVRKVNIIVKDKIHGINWDDFYQDELCWWVFIFMSYPRLNKKVKTKIVTELKRIKNELKDSTSGATKGFVLDFLLDNNVHFIEWNFTKDNYHKNFHFYTKDRTVFNPDIIDQISISR